MKKKLIGLALSAAMLFSVLSVPAFAAAPEESADPALTTEQTAAEEENCFFTSSNTEEEKEPNSITYVALGDSICAGIGLTKVQYSTNLTGVDVSFNFKGYPETCYVGQVAKSLNLDREGPWAGPPARHQSGPARRDEQGYAGAGQDRHHGRDEHPLRLPVQLP